MRTSRRGPDADPRCRYDQQNPERIVEDCDDTMQIDAFVYQVSRAYRDTTYIW